MDNRKERFYIHQWGWALARRPAGLPGHVRWDHDYSAACSNLGTQPHQQLQEHPGPADDCKDSPLSPWDTSTGSVRLCQPTYVLVAILTKTSWDLIGNVAMVIRSACASLRNSVLPCPAAFYPCSSARGCWAWQPLGTLRKLGPCWFQFCKWAQEVLVCLWGCFQGAVGPGYKCLLFQQLSVLQMLRNPISPFSKTSTMNMTHTLHVRESSQLDESAVADSMLPWIQLKQASGVLIRTH